MLLKRGSTYTACWKYRGETIKRPTHETSLTRAREAYARLRAEFNAQRRELEDASRRFRCSVDELRHCEQCGKPFKHVRDDERVCSPACAHILSERTCASPTLAAFLKDRFLPYVEASRGLRPNSKEGYRVRTRALIASELGKLTLDAITSEDVTRFVAARSSWTINAVNAYLRTLGRAVRLAKEWGLTKTRVKVPVLKGGAMRERIVTDEEFACYLAACDEDWRDVAIIMRYEGLRPSEVLDLCWSRDAARTLPTASGYVDLEAGVIQVLTGKTQSARRRLPIAVQAFEVLGQRLERLGGDRVFPRGKAAMLTCHRRAFALLTQLHDEYVEHRDWSAVMRHVQTTEQVDVPRLIDEHRSCLADGLPYFEPYSLRHTCLTQLGEAGVDPWTLARIAGHSSITMTQRYVHPQEEAIMRAFDRVRGSGRKPARSVVNQLKRNGRKPVILPARTTPVLGPKTSL